jgi:hypothetical protein
LTVKTERPTISFANPFVLEELDGAQPAGDYIVETDHELIEGFGSATGAWRLSCAFLMFPRLKALVSAYLWIVPISRPRSRRIGIGYPDPFMATMLPLEKGNDTQFSQPQPQLRSDQAMR